MSTPGVASYVAWNERIARFWFMKPTGAGETYLTVTPRGIAMALWECDGAQLAPEAAETQLIAAVRAGYERWVLHVGGDVSNLARMAPQGDAPLCLCFLAASVLAAHRMRADDGNRAHAYYARLAQVLGVERERDLPAGFSKEGFEALWRFARHWTRQRGLPPLFLPNTDGVVQKYVAYPLAHTELREVDVDKLPEFFDWAGYAPSASVAAERLREDFSQWYPRNLTAQGKAACADRRLDGVVQQVAQELSGWDGVAEDERGRRLAHVELALDVIRGEPKLYYLARRPPGFPDVFEHSGHRFDALEEGWYDPLPVPREDGPHLLEGFEWASAATSSGPTFVLKRRPTRAVALVRSEEYSRLSSRRRLLAGVDCAVLYHESLATVVQARMQRLAEIPWRPIADGTLPSGWRVLLDVRVRPSDETMPAHEALEALEVDSAVELMTVGGLRVGRRAAWLVDCPPRLVVSGMPTHVLVDGRSTKVDPGGLVQLDRGRRGPGIHTIEAGRCHARVEILEASLAEGLPTLLRDLDRTEYSLALPGGTWDVLGARAGEILRAELVTRSTVRLPFDPVWAISHGSPGALVYVGSGQRDVGQELGDTAAVALWRSALCRAADLDIPMASIEPSACVEARRRWTRFVRAARRQQHSVRGVA